MECQGGGAALYLLAAKEPTAKGGAVELPTK
jgi:hypothetical protein